MNLIVVQEEQPDILSSLLNAAFLCLLKSGIRLKTTIFSFDMFIKGEDVGVYSKGVERNPIDTNKISMVLDIINNKVGKHYFNEIWFTKFWRQTLELILSVLRKFDDDGHWRLSDHRSANA